MNKNAIFGLLVILLAFSFIGCDDGSTNTCSNSEVGNDWNQFVGVWHSSSQGHYFTFYPDLSVTRSTSSTSYDVGVYKYDGNTATMIFPRSAHTAILMGDSSMEISSSGSGIGIGITVRYTKL